LERKRKVLEAQIASLYADFESEESEAIKMIGTEQNMTKRLEQDKIEMAASRKSAIENSPTSKLKK
jgi:hypothetical protein